MTTTGGQIIDGVLFAQSFQIISDKRLKTNIEKIDDCLSKVKNLIGCTFNFKSDNSRSAGLIAQDVESILPEAVLENDDHYKTINYGAVVGLLVNAINELAEQVQSLKST